MGISQWLFAATYDLLDRTVQGRVGPHRRQTAGRATGRVLEIGAGTGANLAYYRADIRLTAVEPNPHMARRLRRRAVRLRREIDVVPGRGEALPFDEASFDCVVSTLVL